MSENRFKDFVRVDEVLAQFAIWWSNGTRGPIIPDALARIRELTPPAPLTVTAEQRERALKVAHDWIDDGLLGRSVARSDGESLLDELIDALGITADASHQCADAVGDCCERQSAPVAEAVDVALDDLAAIYILAEEFSDHMNRTDRLEVVVDGDTKATYYRDHKGCTRVVIGGAL